MGKRDRRMERERERERERDRQRVGGGGGKESIRVTTRKKKDLPAAQINMLYIGLLRPSVVRVDEL